MGRGAAKSVKEVAPPSVVSAPPAKVRVRFPLWLMIVGWLAMLVFAFHACTHMVAAGDTWVAMACGRHFVNHGVDTVEPFSANSHKAGPTVEEVKTWPGWAQWITNKVGLDTIKKIHPTGWINQNWLTHVIFYKLTTMLGSEKDPYFDALVYWKFALYMLIVVCLYFSSRLLGANRVLAIVFACAAMFVGRTFLDIRPAGFSNLMVPTFLLILALASYRDRRYVWLIVPLIVLWSNLHGGYIYAFLMLVPFVAWHVILRLPKRWSVAVYAIGTWGVLCLLAHQVFKLDFLSDNAIPFSHDWVLYVFLVAAAGMIALAWNPNISAGVMVGFGVAISLVVFLVYLTRFFPALPEVNAYWEEVFKTDIGGARFAYIGIFAFAMILGATVAMVRDRAVRVMEWNAILHTVAAGVVAFIAMVIFNPFHLTNLTHTFVISVSASAERWRDVHEWHRAFDWTNPVGSAIPFLVLYILGWICLAIWAVVMIRNEQSALEAGKKKKPPVKDARLSKDRAPAPESEYVWPKVDLAFVVIAAMTIYMGIRSRRFIPIAAYAACPVLALLVHEAVGRVLFFFNRRRAGRIEAFALAQSVFEVSLVGSAAALAAFGLIYLVLRKWMLVPIPNERIHPNVGLAFVWVLLPAAAFLGAAVLYALRKWSPASPTEPAPEGSGVRLPVMTAALLLCGYVIGFSGYVGWKFDEVYLQYWPQDTKYTSVFMRMTASDAKPFCACQFIRDNNLKGNMFNYWTEGGFIAWGQTPDPKTGRTPLQLFMDGRAQAAYARTVFDEWTDISTGGPIAAQAARAGRALKQNEYPAVAQWISTELQKYHVWVVLMPSIQFDTPFVGALEVSPDWRVVFTNNKQRLFVDIRTEEGRKLYEDMMAGRAIYPDEFNADMARGHNLLLYGTPEQRKQGLDLIIKAFELEPTPAPVLDMLVLAARHGDLQDQVNQACLRYVEDFETNKAKYAGHDGYSLRIEAARLCLLQLEAVARAGGNKKDSDAFRSQMDQYARERERIADAKRW